MIKKLFRWFSGHQETAPEPLQVGGIFGRMTPEGMCEIDPSKMGRDEIRQQLAALYKRHNHAAGSLDGDLRKEAEMMLDAIVHCREKYVDQAS
ncbi:MAG: hypothetical protein JNJ70_09630 [Verrucomicrobiales bacterium]|nr:hypothetical protein [Verrucomicrobiales bacterium]